MNGWSTEQKKTFLCIYLKDTALTFLDDFERTNPNATLETIEKAFRLKFEHPSRKYMLKTDLDDKKTIIWQIHSLIYKRNIKSMQTN